MYRADKLLEIIENRISVLEFKSEPKKLYEPISYALSSGGKRIRPILTLLACNLFTKNINKAINPAIGLEMFHNFTLLHDDIMDKADIRRNRATVHKKWSENIAILSGDAMLIKSYDFFETLDDNIFKKVFKVFNKTAIEVCEGQQLDMDFELQNDVSEQEYIKMIELKTAVLLGTCLEIGAIIGGATDSQSRILSECGKNLGLAFQLTDDYLDSFGNIENFGKKIGGDITSNKKTFLYIKALKLANNDLKSELKKYFSCSSFDESDKINSVKAIYNKLNIETETFNKINNYYKIAYEYLYQVGIEKNNLFEIISLIEKLKFRKN